MVFKIPAEASQTYKYNAKDFFKDVKSVFNIIALQAIAIISFVIIFNAVKFNMSTSLMIHIILCTLGYLLIMTTAILFFAGDNIFGRPINRYRMSFIHGVFIGIGTLLAIIGISIEIGSRGDEWPHFSSTHSIIGLVSMILMIITFCTGLIITQLHYVLRIIPFMKPLYWKISHDIMGFAAYVTGMISICFSTSTWWVDLIFIYSYKVSFIVACSLVTVWTSISVIYTLFKRFKSLCS